MADTLTLQLAQRGLVTLPKSLRDTYKLEPGDVMTLLDLGGIFVITPSRLAVDALAERIRSELEDQGETLESMLKALRETREGYGS